MSIENKLGYKKVCIGSCVRIQIKTRLEPDTSCIETFPVFGAKTNIDVWFFIPPHTLTRAMAAESECWKARAEEKILLTLSFLTVFPFTEDTPIYKTSLMSVCLSEWLSPQLLQEYYGVVRTERWRIKTRYTFLAVIQIICSILEVEKNSRYFKLSIFHSTRYIYLRHRNSLYLFIRL